jgi:hypothetical protein
LKEDPAGSAEATWIAEPVRNVETGKEEKLDHRIAIENIEHFSLN